MNGYLCHFRFKSNNGGFTESKTVIFAYSQTEAERTLKDQYNNVSVISIIGGYGG